MVPSVIDRCAKFDKIHISYKLYLIKNLNDMLVQEAFNLQDMVSNLHPHLVVFFVDFHNLASKLLHWAGLYPLTTCRICQLGLVYC